MKKYIAYLAGVIIVAVALLISLSAGINSPDKHKNGFDRKIKNQYAIMIREISYSKPITRICGITKHTIFLGTNNPRQLISLSRDLQKMKFWTIAVPEDKELLNAFVHQVDSPKVTTYVGNSNSIYITDLNGINATRIDVEGNLFNNAVRTENGTFIIRQYSKAKRDYTFAKLNSNGKVTGKENNSSKIMQDDGISSQGTLLYSEKFNRIYYVHRLFNTILCLDTNLRSVSSPTTIDTVTLPYIKTTVFEREKGKVRTYSAPPQYTNYRAALSSEFLYVYSLLRSDNEKEATAMDVYSLKDGVYQFSFYLPAKKNMRLTDFEVIDNLLVAIYNQGNHIITYKLNLAEKHILAKSGIAENLKTE